MPFELPNAPTTFQALMNQVFQVALRKFVLVFFDDILVYRKDWISHLWHVEQVLAALMQHQLYAKLSKYQFGIQWVE